MAGAWYSNPEVKVTSSYTGSFSDVGKGKEIATMMFSDGCDYVAPSAGACNLGVFQASKEAGADKWSFEQPTDSLTRCRTRSWLPR